MILCLNVACGAFAQSKYGNARAKADRFFHYKEWGSAAAMCNLMIQERPNQSEPYSRGIVAYEMLGDTLQPMQLLRQAMQYGVPLDSVLSGVQKQAYACGRGAIYEDFMLRAARQNKWMERPLDAYLLRYYSLRSDGPRIVEYAQKMLRGAPRNAAFLLTLADGYMLIGKPESARETWEKVLEIDPRNFDALLCMANLLQIDGQREKALEYFRRAYGVRPTPYIADMIKSLQNNPKI